VQCSRFKPSSNMNWTLSSVQKRSSSKFRQIPKPNHGFSLKFTELGPEPNFGSTKGIRSDRVGGQILSVIGDVQFRLKSRF
jgi:hypothetical protein